MILYCYPSTSKRWQGGIMRIGRFLQKHYEDSNQILFVNSITLDRSNKTKGRFNLLNILDAILFLFRLTSILLGNSKIKVIHINSSSKLALLRDLIITKTLSHVFLKRRFILQIHVVGMSNAFYDNLIINHLNYWLIKNQEIIVLSKHFKSELSEKFFLKNVYVAYNFYNQSETPNILTKPASQESMLKILCVGSIDPNKNFLRLCEELNQLNIKPEITICGGIGDEQYYNDFLLYIKHHSNIKYRGNIEHKKLKEYYLKADILIINSHFEGFPMVIPEAFYFQLPVISTPCGSVKEIIKEGANGFIYDFDDYRALRNHILTLNLDRNLLSRMSNNAADSFKDYTLDKYIENLELNIYQEKL